MNSENRVCPAEKSWLLSNRIRNVLQPPKKLLGNYISEKANVVDLGCGPGHFSIPMAHMVGTQGSVTCVDVQQAMLDKIKGKIKGTKIEKRINLHLCDPDKLNLNGTYNFALAFYMVHEVPNKEVFLSEVYKSLDKGGLFLIVEPKGHVKSDEFEQLIKLASTIGFTPVEKPDFTFSYSILLIK